MIRSESERRASANWKPWKLDAAGVAFLAAVTLGAYLLQIQPAIRHHEHARLQAIELASARAKARELERTVQLTRDQLAAAQRAASQASLALQPPSAMNQRLAQLTELAGANRLAIDALESGALAHAGGIPATAGGQRHALVPIRVSGRGDYRSFQIFLHRLRQNMPDLAVVSFDLTATGLRAEAGPDGSTSDAPGADRNFNTSASYVMDLLWFTQPPAQSGSLADGK
jgi:hypothetical protein